VPVRTAAAVAPTCRATRPTSSRSGTWIDLSAGEAYGAIVGVNSVSVSEQTFVEPGDPEGSYLWHKINGTQASVGGGGLDMPSPVVGMDDPTVLTQEQYDTIEAWIAGGAPE